MINRINISVIDSETLFCRKSALCRFGALVEVDEAGFVVEWMEIGARSEFSEQRGAQGFRVGMGNIPVGGGGEHQRCVCIESGGVEG